MIYAERADVSTPDETVAQIWSSLLLTLGFMGGGLISAVEPWTFTTTVLAVSVSSQHVQSFPERPCSRLDAALTTLLPDVC